MKITTQDYIKEQVAWMDKLRQADRAFFEAEISAMRRAVDKYSDTNDEWKTTHNNLQRQMQKQGEDFIKKEELKRSIGTIWGVIIGLAMFFLGLAMYLKK
jgi:hypothetical protein